MINEFFTQQYIQNLVQNFGFQIGTIKPRSLSFENLRSEIFNEGINEPGNLVNNNFYYGIISLNLNEVEYFIRNGNNNFSQSPVNLITSFRGKRQITLFHNTNDGTNNPTGIINAVDPQPTTQQTVCLFDNIIFEDFTTKDTKFAVNNTTAQLESIFKQLAVSAISGMSFLHFHGYKISYL